eukprot:352454-Chlamydomonas_euryale.AAC.15
MHTQNRCVLEVSSYVCVYTERRGRAAASLVKIASAAAWPGRPTYHMSTVSPHGEGHTHACSQPAPSPLVQPSRPAAASVSHGMWSTRVDARESVSLHAGAAPWLKGAPRQSSSGNEPVHAGKKG